MREANPKEGEKSPLFWRGLREVGV